jgi:O-glycosyl hydrolase
MGLSAATKVERSAASTTVDLDTRYQKITGFGFSEVFGRSNDIYNLKEPERQEVLDLLFSTETGAGMTIVRNRIAESGQGAIENTEPATPTSAPTYVPLNDTQVWVCQQAMKYGVNTFYNDAWSAPPLYVRYTHQFRVQ